jgi:hypothetical protein
MVGDKKRCTFRLWEGFFVFSSGSSKKTKGGDITKTESIISKLRFRREN